MVDARVGYGIRVMGKSIERLFENEPLRSTRSSQLRALACSGSSEPGPSLSPSIIRQRTTRRLLARQHRHERDTRRAHQIPCRRQLAARCADQPRGDERRRAAGLKSQVSMNTVRVTQVTLLCRSINNRTSRVTAAYTPCELALRSATMYGKASPAPLTTTSDGDVPTMSTSQVSIS